MDLSLVYINSYYYIITKVKNLYFGAKIIKNLIYLSHNI